MQGKKKYYYENFNHNYIRSITVADIMTKNPMCVTADTSAQDALNLMVSRGFRHLVKAYTKML
jgi:CBS domain-containing protein